jgi:hypothetical protein
MSPRPGPVVKFNGHVHCKRGSFLTAVFVIYQSLKVSCITRLTYVISVERFSFWANDFGGRVAAFAALSIKNDARDTKPQTILGHKAAIQLLRLHTKTKGRQSANKNVQIS